VAKDIDRYVGRIEELAGRAGEAILSARGSLRDALGDSDAHTEKEKARHRRTHDERRAAALAKQASGLDAEEAAYATERKALAVRRATLETRFRAARKRAEADLKAWLGEAGLFAAAWDEPVWADWSPQERSSPPFAVRIGELSKGKRKQRWTTPALLPFAGGRSILFEPSPTHRASCSEAVRALAARLLLALPPGMLEILVLDPSGRGDNAGDLLYLADFESKLLKGGRAWTEDDHIAEQLHNILGHIDHLKQSKLRTKYRDIEAYNAETRYLPLPYVAVLVFDFPLGFTTDAAQRLASIAERGPACGVVPIIVMNDEVKKPYEFTPDSIRRVSTCFRSQGDGMVWDEEVLSDAALALDDAPSGELFRERVRVIGQRAIDAREAKVPFESIAPGEPDWWEAGSSDLLRVKLGARSAEDPCTMTLGGRDGGHHVVVVGATGSGKSSLLHALIMNLALSYSPDELRLYLIDLKQVEFKPYAAQALPHAEVVAIQSDREFALAVLRGLAAEMLEREELLTQHGLQKISEYRKSTGEVVPRIVLVLDEFQVLLDETDEIARESGRLINHLVKLARNVGIHLVLSSQSLDTVAGRGLPPATLGQFGIRIALKCSLADCRNIFGNQNTEAARIQRVGEAVYNNQLGDVGANTRFQVAWLDADERSSLLAKLRARCTVERTPLVFEGQGLGRLENNPMVRGLLGESEPWSGALEASLGEPVTMESVVSVSIGRRVGCNLLVVGQDVDKAVSILLSAMVSIAAQTDPHQARFHVVQLTEAGSHTSTALLEVTFLLPHTARVGGRRSIGETVGKLADLVRHRSQAQESLPGACSWPAEFLVLAGGQRAKDLAAPQGAYYLDEDDPATQPRRDLLEILRSGPEVGVFCLAWFDARRNAEAILGDDGLKEFDERVVLQLPAGDSRSLLDNDAGADLGGFRALYYSGEKGVYRKLRPYSLPDEALLERLRVAFSSEDTP
jgi:S-DNA-T family DNA segregation ATPase FtsK/SpoIIIE